MSRHFRVWTILLAVGLLAGAGRSRSPEPQKARHLERGDKYAARAYMLLGSAYLANGQAAKATETFRRLVVLAPKDPRGPYLVGGALRAHDIGIQWKRSPAWRDS